MVGYYPLTNSPGVPAQNVDNYLTSGKAILSTNNYLARVDHYISEYERLFGRVGYATYTSFSSISVPLRPGSYHRFTAGHDRLIGLTSTLSPNWLGEFTRLQVNNYPQSQGFTPSQLGFGPAFTNYVG